MAIRITTALTDDWVVALSRVAWADNLTGWRRPTALWGVCHRRSVFLTATLLFLYRMEKTVGCDPFAARTCR